jgi:hypothetical protein
LYKCFTFSARFNNGTIAGRLTTGKTGFVFRRVKILSLHHHPVAAHIIASDCIEIKNKEKKWKIDD